ncbi:MAG: TonB-dependent receptor [Sphingomonadales bacterium]|nr:TonB-dependent receptor [Sphingomonadales bacterium]
MKNLKRALMLSSLSVAVAPAASFAQEAADNAEYADEIIVTGVAKATTVFQSSASVSSLPSEEIQNLAPRSINELFRAIPGVKSEDTGGDANANIKVRGLPIASGGSRYLSLQEDGFPTLLVGDVAFSTADSYLRVDNTIGSVQSIRGGSASTQAPNAAGGIINLISKKPTERGGSIAATFGIDYESYRVDAEYGDALDNGLYYHIGGFARTGEGVRDTVGNFEEGYQIKATVGKDFERGNIAFHFKRLDDRVPTYLPLPAVIQNDDSIGPLNGLDLGSGTTSLGLTDTALRLNDERDVDTEGFQAEMTSIGIEGQFDLTEQLTFAAKGRWADISGNFYSPFPAGLAGTNPDGSSNINFVLFNTSVPDVGNLFGDVSLTGDFDFFTVKAGLFYADQKSEQVWSFNDARATLSGGRFITDDPTNLFLNPLDGSFINGQSYGNPNFGNCCTVSWDFDIEQLAPFFSANVEFGDLTIEGSYRRTMNNVSGEYIPFGTAIIGPFDADGDGVIGTNEQGVQRFNNAALVTTDYDADHNNFSIGANYEVNDNLAVFANYSEGASLTAPDRSTGNLVVAGGVGASPSGDLFLNFVEQYEVGVRLRFGAGALNIVYFDAQVAEAAQFEATTQEVIQTEFDTKGVEIEGDFEIGNGFGLRGNLTFTDSDISGPASNPDLGNRSRRQAPFNLNLNPYYVHDRFDVGFNIYSVGKAPVQNSNQFDLPAYTTVGAYVNFEVIDNITVSLNANNLFDEVGFTEGEEGNPAIGDFVRYRPINGRTIRDCPPQFLVTSRRT